jgi:hypothetical protein
VAWRGVAWRGVAWRGVAWRGVAWRGVAWRGVACCVVKCFAVRTVGKDHIQNNPPQDNSCDCGVFAILTAIFIVLALPLTFKPGVHITNARRHMTHLLLNLNTVSSHHTKNAVTATAADEAPVSVATTLISMCPPLGTWIITNVQRNESLWMLVPVGLMSLHKYRNLHTSRL